MSRRFRVPLLAFLGLLPALPTSSLQADGPLRFYTTGPCRQVDTRTHGDVLLHGVTRYFRMAAAPCSVPSDARAVALTVTVTQPTSDGHIRLAPASQVPPNQPFPIVSVLNFRTNEDIANGAIVPIGAIAEGDLAAMATGAPNATVHLILDIVGYYK